MKFKEYLTKLKAQAKIEKEDFDKYIETIPAEQEIPDAVVASIEENFLTRDRAKVDKDVYGKVKAEVYNAIDSNITGLLPDLDNFDQVAIEGEKDTHKKINMLRDAYKRKIEKISSSDPNKDKKVEEMSKTINELTSKITQLNSDFADKEKKVVAEHQNKLKEIKIDSDLSTRIKDFTLADEFSDPVRKKAITKIIMSEIKENHLDYDENGQLHVYELHNGVPKPKFNGNDPVTFDKVVETAISPYLKRNNAENGKSKETTRQTNVSDAQPEGQTLSQRRAAHYASK